MATQSKSTKAKTNATEAGDNGKESKVQMPKAEFMKKAKVRMITVEGTALEAKAIVFKSGGVGYNLNGKVILEVDGVPLRFQMGGNLSLIGSKHEE